MNKLENQCTVYTFSSFFMLLHVTLLTLYMKVIFNRQDLQLGAGKHLADMLL